MAFSWTRARFVSSDVTIGSAVAHAQLCFVFTLKRMHCPAVLTWEYLFRLFLAVIILCLAASLSVALGPDASHLGFLFG
eukprot:2751720-Pyramimonas_sp.AAC.1